MAHLQTMPRLPRRPAVRNWDTEVFVVGAEDRGHLLLRLRELQRRLTQHAEVEPVDLAFSLNTESASGGARLAMVASSIAELRERLARAVGRLADPQCRQINDTQGIYYFDEPLYAVGGVALLFPGEGAQYLNMLRDLLPHFPEVDEHFARCDRISLQAGKREHPVTHSIFLPVDAPAERRAAAETELARLDNAAAGVLMANWALYQVLCRMGLGADAVAGHSSGEISALAAAGCVETDDHLLAELFRLGHALQQQETEGQMGNTALLAVAAGSRQVAQAIEDVSGELYVAMDNCPHQTVVGGTRAAVHDLKQRLQEAGIACEGLPFNRPYHTPLFQRHLDPMTRMFDALRLRSPRVKIYSCATARAMPEDPAEIRRLAISQWATRVEFTRLIQTMYDDGLRVFVEVGPRGNLTSFVQDVLRGRAFAAVASDVPHRSGVCQLNHLVAQLTAHHVPLDLTTLVCRRDPHGVDWATSSSHRQAVLLRHLALMKDFLKLQQEVHEHFLRSAGPAAGLSNSAKHVSPRNTAGQAGSGTQIAEHVAGSGRPMIGEIVRHEPGRLLVMRRRVELREDLYARDHTLGGRSASAIDPNHHGLAVMPMALNLEMMAEVASLLAPGKQVIGFAGVRLHRWIPLYEEPISLEVTARVLAPGKQGVGRGKLKICNSQLAIFNLPGECRVSLEIRDLGNSDGVTGRQGDHGNRESFTPSPPHPVTPSPPHPLTPSPPHPVTPSPPHPLTSPPAEPLTLSRRRDPTQAAVAAVEGTVVLGDRYRAPPAVEDFSLTDERPCPMGPDEFYRTERRMFHGPLFQAVHSNDRMGKEGIEGHLVTLSHAGLFRSTSRPELILDPLLIDASTHILGSWHLSQHDRSGRVVFPYELGSLQLFGPRPEQGTRLKCQVRVERVSSRQASHRIDLFTPDGKLWCRVHPAEFWRFYWPPECVDFFRHHDRYLVSRELPVALPVIPCNCTPASENGGLAGEAPEGNSVRWFCTKEAPDVVQPVIRAAMARVALCPSQWQTFYHMQGSEARRTEWLFGRIAAKDCIRALWHQQHGRRLFPADLEIRADAHGQPSARHLGPEELDLPCISIAHSEGVVVALAAWKQRVGIDLEPIRPRGAGFEEIAFDRRERTLLDRFGERRDEGIARFWCAREAVAKALGRGLVEGPRSLAVRDVDHHGETMRVELGPALGRLFPELAASLLVARTSRRDNFVVATTFAEAG